MNIDHELIHQVHQLSRKLTKKLNEVLLPYGLYSAQWSVIYVLNEKGTLTQKELCEYLSVEAPPMTRTIKRLAKQGYVSQELGSDKRKKYIALTDKALASFPEWEKAVMKMDIALGESLSEFTRKELTIVLSKWFKQL